MLHAALLACTLAALLLALRPCLARMLTCTVFCLHAASVWERRWRRTAQQGCVVGRACLSCLLLEACVCTVAPLDRCSLACVAAWPLLIACCSNQSVLCASLACHALCVQALFWCALLHGSHITPQCTDPLLGDSKQQRHSPRGAVFDTPPAREPRELERVKRCLTCARVLCACCVHIARLACTPFACACARAWLGRGGMSAWCVCAPALPHQPPPDPLQQPWAGTHTAAHALNQAGEIPASERHHRNDRVGGQQMRWWQQQLCAAFALEMNVPLKHAGDAAAHPM